MATISASATDSAGIAGVQFFVDGTALGAEVTVAPYTIAWDTRTTANGSHSLNAIARDTAGLRSTSATVTINVSNAQLPATSSPFTGTAFVVPTRIEAENFDLGGEGVAYYRIVPGNLGGFYRPSEGVSIVNPYPLGYAIDNFRTGEWLQYTINVTQPGNYRFDLVVSSITSSSRFHVEVDGVDKTGSIAVPNTGWWTTFQWVGKSGISLPSGQHLLRVFSDQEFFNFDAIVVTLESTTGRTRPGRH